MEKKVLIVDNNKVILRLLTHFFHQKEYQVLTAENGLEALKIIPSFKPDLIFVDLIMPKINGEKLCRIIRKMPEFNSTFIVIISAIASEDKVDFISFGANACIAKGPFKEMQTNISTVLNCLYNNEFDLLSNKIFSGKNIFERDITKELLATKKHYEIALDNMVDGFLEVTLESTIIFANKAAIEFLGASEEELLSAFFPNFFPIEQKKIIEDTFSRLAGESIEVGDDAPIVLNERRLFLRLIPFIDQDQKSVIVLMHDVTEQKQSELDLIKHKEKLENAVAQRTAEYEETNEQLQEEIVERSIVQKKLEHSVNQWRETFDVMSDFVSVHDNEMKLVKVNKSMADFFGKKPEELIGKHCYELMHNSQVPIQNCPHIQATEKLETVTEEIEEPHLEKTLLVTCSPIFDKTGTTIGTVHVARDVTKKKQMEIEKEKLINELQDALDEIKTLRGILPVCSYCKNIRDDKGAWSRIESYISARSEATFSHSICPGCLKENHPEEYESLVLKGKIKK